MIRRHLMAAACVLAMGLTGAARAQQAPAPEAAGPERFASAIDAFTEEDKVALRPPCQIVFTGSSSVRFWKTLGEDLAPAPVLNRGFGGSQVSDVDFYFDQVVGRYRPRAIFFYAGDNDVHAGKSVDTVVADFQQFMDLKTKALGDTPVYFISLKPSKARIAEKPQQDAVNAKVKAMTAARRDLTYVDIVPSMLDAAGQPKDIFIADGLHMTPEGYRLWTEVVRPVVEREMARKSACAPAS